jgi:hypothetical protein
MGQQHFQRQGVLLTILSVTEGARQLGADGGREGIISRHSTFRAPNRTISTAIDSSMNSHIVGRSTIT